MRVVSTYIGVSDGYLNGFTYAGLSEFYPVYCDVELDPMDFPGNTTRERFIGVLRSSAPNVQEKILRGLLEKIPEPTAEGPVVMTRDDVAALAAKLEGIPVPAAEPENAPDVVRQALRDAQDMIDGGRPSSAVDRLHTALHGYLRSICDDADIEYERDDTVQKLLKLISMHHPRILEDEQTKDLIQRILGPLSTVVDRINDARNTKSLAHPNEDLLGDAEAILVINMVRTLLHYLEGRLG